MCAAQMCRPHVHAEMIIERLSSSAFCSSLPVCSSAVLSPLRREASANIPLVYGNVL